MCTDVACAEPVVEPVAPEFAEDCADDRGEPGAGEGWAGEAVGGWEQELGDGVVDADDPGDEHHDVD